MKGPAPKPKMPMKKPKPTAKPEPGGLPKFDPNYFAETERQGAKAAANQASRKPPAAPKRPPAMPFPKMHGGGSVEAARAFMAPGDKPKKKRK